MLAPDALTPMLDPAAAPGRTAATFLLQSEQMLHEDEHEAEYRPRLEKSRRTGKPMEIDRRGRPIIPRWPLMSGVLPFLFSRGVPVVLARYFRRSRSERSLVLGNWHRNGGRDGGAFAGMCLLRQSAVR